MIVWVEMYSQCLVTQAFCINGCNKHNTVVIKNTITKAFTLTTDVGNGFWADLWYSSLISLTVGDA